MPRSFIGQSNHTRDSWRHATQMLVFSSNGNVISSKTNLKYICRYLFHNMFTDDIKQLVGVLVKSDIRK